MRKFGLERNPENVVRSGSVTDAVFRKIARQNKKPEQDRDSIIAYLAPVLIVLALAGCQQPQTSIAPPPLPVAPSLPQQPVPPPQVASAGPLKAAAVGTYMDAQEADLREYLRGQGVVIARRGDSLTLIVANDRIFDKSAISPWGNAFLTSLYQVLGHYDHAAVEVNAYTDATGPAAQNQTLSETRAKAITAVLARYGIAAVRLTAKGLGATDPKVLDPNSAQNRRIEIKITPTPQG
jgi:outer membrane protein OmpA-like peptidoglycan-associated protein